MAGETHQPVILTGKSQRNLRLEDIPTQGLGWENWCYHSLEEHVDWLGNIAISKPWT